MVFRKREKRGRMMFKKILKSYDYTVVIAIVLLSLFGLIMVYSASMATAVQRWWFIVTAMSKFSKPELFLPLLND